MADPGFVHLHVHSAYSLLEGALPIARLSELAVTDRQPALALTDTGNLFGALEFSEKLAEAGIQPIIGCALAVDVRRRARGHATARACMRLPRIVLLAANEDGYRNLMALVSKSFLEVEPETAPHVTADWLAAHADGLIALTGGPDGPIDGMIAAEKPELARARLGKLEAIFDRRLYVEIQRHGLESERAVEPALLELADEAGLPIVATNEPFFATREDYEAHDALICIAEGRVVAETDRRQMSPEHRFKTRLEMAELFADLPEAIEASVEIAKRCAFRPKTRNPILPRFTVGDSAADEGKELKKRAEAGLAARIKSHGIAPGRSRAGIPRPARLRARGHRRHEIRRLLPDRRRFHRVGEESRHSGRAGARLGRGLAGGLCADHHRSRSAPLRAAVRAVPQSRSACRCRTSTSTSARTGATR